MLSFPQATRPLTGALGPENSALSCRSTTSRRLLSSSATLNQARERVRRYPSPAPPCRPTLGKHNPYLPATSLIGPRPSAVSIHEACKYPIRIPQSAVDTELLKSGPVPSPPNQAISKTLSPNVVLKIRQAGERQVKRIVVDWVRNELNVNGTIRENTIEKFMQLILNPSTLAPLAIAMKLRTDGQTRPIKASLHAPARIVPAATHADIELTQLLYYFIGSLHRSLPKTASAASSSPLLKKYVIDLLKSGLPHTSPAKLLIRASELSGQAVIGIKKGHARAELRVAQLCIWGERRSKKLRKLVPDQKCHRNALNVRKAELLKQRWKDEEVKMVLWRRRLLEVTAAQKADAEAHRLERRARTLEVAKRRESRKTEVVKPSSPGLFSRLFSFWNK